MPATFTGIYTKHGPADVPFMEGTAEEDVSGVPALKTTLAAGRLIAGSGGHDVRVDNVYSFV